MTKNEKKTSQTLSTREQLQLNYEQQFSATKATPALAMSAASMTALTCWAGGDWIIPAAGFGAVAAISGGVSIAKKSGAKIGEHGSSVNVSTPWRVPRVMAGVLSVFGAESAYAVWSNPYTWEPSQWLTAGAALLVTTVGSWFALDEADGRDEGHHKALLDREGRLDAQEFGVRIAPMMSQWVKHVEDAVHFRPFPVEYKEWDNGKGFTILWEVPQGRAVKTLTGAGELIGDNARIPDGCSIEFTASGVRGRVYMNVQTVPPSEHSDPIPGDMSPLSINGATLLGEDMTGHVITAALRQACILLIGATGTGKTNTLATIIAQLLRCTDVLVWGIDLGKGQQGFGKFIRTTKEGRELRGLDWTAGGIDAAIRVIEAGIAVAKHRDNGSGKVKITAERPMIFIVIDEGAELLALTSEQRKDRRYVYASERLYTLLRVGRSGGVRVILTGTAATTATLGSTTVKQNCSVKLVLTGGDQSSQETTASNLQYTIGAVRGIDRTHLRAAGAGVLEIGGKIGVFRSYFGGDDEGVDYARDEFGTAPYDWILEATNGYRPRLEVDAIAAIDTAAKKAAAEVAATPAEQRHKVAGKAEMYVGMYGDRWNPNAGAKQDAAAQAVSAVSEDDPDGGAGEAPAATGFMAAFTNSTN